MILAATQIGITSGGSQTQCSPVTFTPPDGSDAPGTVTVATTTSGAHIFYTKNNDTGITPTHVGDNATGSTVRIGSSTGVITGVGTVGHSVVLEAVAYQAGLLDSGITIATYNPLGPPGNGHG